VSAADKRTATRHAVSLPAMIGIEGKPESCTIVNLSLGGALVVAGSKLSMGQRVTISFHISTVEEAIDVGSTVRWSDDKGVGLQFDGLRARDVWALNKYFEQLG
jgi:hypothetical protein